MNNYRGIFEDWEIAIVRSLVGEFQKKHELLKKEAYEDLLQECFLHWLAVKDGYDKGQVGTKETYFYRTIRNKLKNIVEKIYADKRKPTYQSISLEELLKDKHESTLLNTSEVQSVLSVFILQTHLRIDLSRAIQGLTHRQKELCRLLGKEGLTVSEASEKLNISKDTIYEELRRIRGMFEKDKLEEYLK